LYRLFKITQHYEGVLISSWLCPERREPEL
jgi:hypothetical protein